MNSSDHTDEALGESDAFVEFQERLSRAAQVDRPVLLMGERGTGKELAARRLHYLSRRWQNPLVPLNCAALSPGLLEAELFGHEAGAFTGATKRRAGRFESAHQGTLFLDEIGLLPMSVQEKILRVVEYGRFERVGSSEPIDADVRIVAATNADILAMAHNGSFKQDLLDRLSFEVLILPPLRMRVNDIPVLARHFALRMSLEMNWDRPPEFSASAMGELERFPWPGNIRELKNVVERAVYVSHGGQIAHIDFDPFSNAHLSTMLRKTQPDSRPAQDSQAPQQGPTFDLGRTRLADALARLEIEALRAALAQTQHHQGKSAELLGMSYDQFRRLVRKHKTAL